jgi:hypothetical protein
METYLLNKIIAITDQIREQFPSTYLLLTETPLFLSYETKGISDSDLLQYLESIRSQAEQLKKRKFHQSQ